MASNESYLLDQSVSISDYYCTVKFESSYSEQLVNFYINDFAVNSNDYSAQNGDGRVQIDEPNVNRPVRNTKCMYAYRGKNCIKKNECIVSELL